MKGTPWVPVPPEVTHKRSRELLAKAVSSGLELSFRRSSSNHIIVRLPNGETCSLASTPSDHRSMDNVESAFRRLGILPRKGADRVERKAKPPKAVRVRKPKPAPIPTPEPVVYAVPEQRCTLTDLLVFACDHCRVVVEVAPVAAPRLARVPRVPRTTSVPFFVEVPIPIDDPFDMDTYHLNEAVQSWTTKAARSATYRDRLRAERVDVGGRWVHPDAVHGSVNGYASKQCRCRPCTDAMVCYVADRKALRESGHRAAS